MTLGFTFYPKDWWASDSFYILNPFERYLYLELLFMMYANDGLVTNDRVMIEARLRTAIREDSWEKVTGLLIKEGDQLTHKSVNKRLAKRLANRENGKKGGRPPKPKKPNLETQKNPRLEREREIERENKEKDRQDFLTNRKWKEEFCMAKGITLVQLEKLQQEWLKDIDLIGKPVDNYKGYFLNCYNKNRLQQAIKVESVDDKMRAAR
jgi:hypothetical protein